MEFAEEKATQSELLLKRTLSLAKLGGWEFDLSTGLFLFNDNFYEIFRSSAEKNGGYTLSAKKYAERFVHPDDRNVVEIEIGKAIQTDDPEFSSYLEHRIVYEDGEVGYIAVKFFIIKDKEGKTIKTYGINQDITDRKKIENDLLKAKQQAEESETKLLEAQALSHVGSWEYITETDTVTWSKELFNIFERSYDLPAPRYSEQKPFYTPESFAQLDRAVQDCVLHEIPYDLALDIITSHGSIKQIISKGQVKRDANNKIIGCYGTAQDITKQKKLELDLTFAKERAEESDRLKTAFLQNLSHEIRTPLNAICGFSQILNKQNLTDEVRKNYISLIQSSSNQLLSIVSDVLATSALEKGQEQITIKETNVTSVMEELLSIFKPKADAKNISLILKQGLTDDFSVIETDETKFRQILTNLLTNALKFTDEGGVEFGYNLVKNNLEFFVKDSGIGIKPEMHDIIFERFRQADSTISEKYGGTGLGLSISKGYIELLGGKIWVNSEPEKGSLFYFTIPYQPIRKNETQNTNEDFTILVVEDELLNFMVIQGLLTNLKAKLIHARDGQEAVDCFKANPNINLILMDVKMPGLSGDKAAKIIKSINPNLPIIAQSGYALENERAKYDGIFDDYLTKPLHENILIKKISKYMEADKL